eukprot:scaffold3046_cov105-Cylindrotheca_fusiformis.AAC.15
MSFRTLIILGILSFVCAAAVASDVTTKDDDKVSIRFYGEALCPYCRRFVTTVWQPIWEDLEFRDYLDYDFIPWGNAYFGTEKCGSGPYSSQERACWYKNCMESQSDDESACFGGAGVYQHGPKEGQLDIYESCVKTLFGLDFAVEFTFCAEGPDLDDDSMDAKALMTKCASNVIPKVDLDSIEECSEAQGKDLEILNAKQTPTHPGVPYVVINGNVIEDISETKKIICTTLTEKGIEALPKGCYDIDKPFLRLPRAQAELC